MDLFTRKLKFNKNIYKLEAIKKSSYKFINKFSNVISESEDNYICSISFPNDVSESQVEFCLDEFKKEISDQDLRIMISKETEDVRNLILSYAFSKTDLIKK